MSLASDFPFLTEEGQKQRKPGVWGWLWGQLVAFYEPQFVTPETAAERDALLPACLN